MITPFLKLVKGYFNTSLSLFSIKCLLHFGNKGLKMNEFIVWDKTKKMFCEDNRFDFRIDREGELYNLGKIKMNSKYENLFEHFNYIGKTDIEGEKIYADSSVVEFEFRLFDDEDYKTLKGYFSYNSEYCLYELREPYAKNSYMIYYLKDGDLKNLKIIGTLQEDKHLLGEYNE